MVQHKNAMVIKKGPLKARDVMNREIITIGDETSVWDIAKIFSERAIHGAPVVDRGGSLVGVVSQTDIVGHLRKIANDADERHSFYSDADDGPKNTAGKPVTARELMSPNVITASEDCPIDELSRILLLHHIHRIIITKGRRIQGIVTTTDVLRAL